MSTATYLIKFKIPEEVWKGKELKYSQLRTFSCTAYVHVDPEKRDKLDAKAVKCYFIVYSLICLLTGFGMTRTERS